MEPSKQAQSRHRVERCPISTLKQGAGGVVQTLAREVPAPIRESGCSASARTAERAGAENLVRLARTLRPTVHGVSTRVVHGYEVAKPNAREQISGYRVWVTGTIPETDG